VIAAGQWFSPGTLVSSTNKTDRHGITEILLKVALNTIIIIFLFQDFPRNSYEPKVQLPFYTKPGDCPRKIEVERFVI